MMEIKGGGASSGLQSVTIYDDSIVVDLYKNAATFLGSNIIDMYVTDHAGEQAVIIEQSLPDGRVMGSHLPDKMFPGLVKAIQGLLKDGWGNILAKRAYPDTVKWLTAHNGILMVIYNGNPMIYGSRYPHPAFAKAQRKTLNESWGVTDRPSYIQYMSNCMNGRAYNNTENGSNYLINLIYFGNAKV
jgi:hypothetical protein